jgi:hypothetical protein
MRLALACSSSSSRGCWAVGTFSRSASAGPRPRPPYLAPMPADARRARCASADRSTGRRGQSGTARSSRRQTGPTAGPPARAGASQLTCRCVGTRRSADGRPPPQAIAPCRRSADHGPCADKRHAFLAPRSRSARKSVKNQKKARYKSGLSPKLGMS